MNYKQTVVVGLLVAGLLAGGAAVATAQEAPPGEPASFYGTVQDENGVDAPEGTSVYAVVLDENGNAAGQSSITVLAAGEYGGPDSFDDKLRVDSTTGTEVAFRVGSADGPTATTVNLEAGTQNVDLTFPAGAFQQDPDDTVGSGDGTVGDDGVAQVTLPSGGNAQSVRVRLPSGSGASRVTVIESLSPTGGAPTPENNVAVYLDIAADVSVDGDVEVTVTIDQTALDNAGIAVEDAVLLHYTDGSWNPLVTDASSDGSGSVTVTATSNGLSPFAVAESSDTGGGSTGGGGGGGAATINDGDETTDDDADTTDGGDSTTDGGDSTTDGGDSTEDTDSGTTDGSDGAESGGGDGGGGLFGLGTVPVIGIVVVVIAVLAIATVALRNN